jgi:hypothetical protein
MVQPRAGGYWFRMTTTTATPASIEPRSRRAVSEPRLRGPAVLAAALLAVFGAFSGWVVITRGYFGFVALAGRERWALQMLMDLVIALTVAVGWMSADARKRRIAIWPYVVATVVLGSIGVLAYCVRRGFAPITPPPGT